MLLRVRIVFVRQCLAWMVYGILEDPGAEFFVQLRSRQHNQRSCGGSVKDLALRLLENMRLPLKQEFGESRKSKDALSDTEESSFDWNLLYIQVY